LRGRGRGAALVFADGIGENAAKFLSGAGFVRNLASTPFDGNPDRTF
jgi:hypothetical protein